jgi:hypothetical protein
MSEGEFHAKDSSKAFSKILACSQPHTASQAVRFESVTC